MEDLTLPLEKYDADTMKACIGKTLREIPKQVFDDFMRLRDEWKPSEPVDTGTCYSFQFRTKNGIPMEFEAKRHISRGIYMQTRTDYRNNLGGHNYWSIALRSLDRAKLRRKPTIGFTVYSLCWVPQSYNSIRIGDHGNTFAIKLEVRTKKEVRDIAETIKNIYNLK